MSKNKSYRKYAITTVAAAAAVATVAPVVASADTTTGFPDVNDASVPDQEMRDAIANLVDQGAIVGDNGMFHPNDSVLRGQVAQIMTEALELPIPSDVAGINAQYSDAHLFGANADYIAAVTDAGVFHGSDGTFGVWNEMSRQQMATALKRFMTSLDIEPEETVTINLDNVSPSHQEGVQYLADMGLTTQLTNFKAYDDVSRVQFATFFVRAQDAIEDAMEAEEPKVESVEAINATQVEVKFNTAVDMDSIFEFGSLEDGVFVFAGLETPDNTVDGDAAKIQIVTEMWMK